jgi:hypothetical protein
MNCKHIFLLLSYIICSSILSMYAEGSVTNGNQILHEESIHAVNISHSVQTPPVLAGNRSDAPDCISYTKPEDSPLPKQRIVFRTAPNKGLLRDTTYKIKGKIHFDIKAGYGNTIYEERDIILNDRKELYEAYKHGASLSASCDYFFHEALGVGILYSFYYVHTKQVTLRVHLFKPGQYEDMTFSDQISTHYIAPVFKARIPLSRSSFIFGLSGGYLGFRDMAQVNATSSLYTKNTWAMGLLAYYDYMLSKRISINLNVSFLYAQPIKLSFNNTSPYRTAGTRNMNRGEVSAGMRYRLN